MDPLKKIVLSTCDGERGKFRRCCDIHIKKPKIFRGQCQHNLCHHLPHALTSSHHHYVLILNGGMEHAFLPISTPFANPVKRGCYF
ncbi:hypothetical protein E2C01_029053 [Portunus trituberculatus]|uniref:Uncharacterized protein n=1 Tax=Portunus trituberculatus TaxID=210409 RepID=A0A5B7EQU9_PORTR|nr:hypothetical protein [Portunus trituberculatus]